MEKIYQAGILREQNFLSTAHAAYGVYEGMSVALANCLGRYRVTDHLFGFSYAAVDEEMKTPSVLGPQQQTRLYALSNGLVPTAGLQVINDLSVGGFSEFWNSKHIAGENIVDQIMMMILITEIRIY